MNSENIDLMIDKDVDCPNLSEEVLHDLALEDELFIVKFTHVVQY
ncbi:hypothetical protein NIES4071_76340 [Calothrix sp. NIES-4071]|nr:hypothetical protein NIES4071_76340 [Calothrix sp. NIES-4071]BAZ61909.1 hypothetical protein NIES4105_76290 [Calothrix sp. NIES-4105]